MVAVSELNGVASLYKLFETLATEKNWVSRHDKENYECMHELWYLFCVIWSVCASVDEDGRKKIDNYIREIEGTFPNKDSIYAYFLDVKNKTWAHLEDKLRGGWRCQPNLPFYRIIVPILLTVRYDFLVNTLIQAVHPVLMVGPVGTGKTSVAQAVLGKLEVQRADHQHGSPDFI
ncbi:dynein axonemal heavy chain 2-like [Ptychodera flava]|uniref:dynein axonemal heavy chain 2-like n=1 Tax=Ptychodera flava TaxID=63121 RepID=UPI00396A395A